VLGLLKVLRANIDPFPQFQEVHIALDRMQHAQNLDGLGQVLASWLHIFGSFPEEQRREVLSITLGGVAEKLQQLLPSPPVPSAPAIHGHVVCDGCGAHPIVGPRFKCKTCPDFDLCGECYARKGELHPSHDFDCMLQQQDAHAGKGWQKGWHNGCGKGGGKAWQCPEHFHEGGWKGWKGSGKWFGKSFRHHWKRGHHSSSSSSSSSSSGSSGASAYRKKYQALKKEKKEVKRRLKEEKRALKVAKKASKEEMKAEKKRLKKEAKARKHCSKSAMQAEPTPDTPIDMQTESTVNEPGNVAFQQELQQLEDMGFKDTALNMQLLAVNSGNVHAVLESLT